MDKLTEIKAALQKALCETDEIYQTSKHFPSRWYIDPINSELLDHAPSWLQWQNEQIEHARNCAEQAWKREDELEGQLISSRQENERLLNKLQEIDGQRQFAVARNERLLKQLKLAKFALQGISSTEKIHLHTSEIRNIVDSTLSVLEKQ